MLGAIVIGILAGWLAGKLMRGSGYGILGDLVLGASARGPRRADAAERSAP